MLLISQLAYSTQDLLNYGHVVLLDVDNNRGDEDDDDSDGGKDDVNERTYTYGDREVIFNIGIRATLMN